MAVKSVTSKFKMPHCVKSGHVRHRGCGDVVTTRRAAVRICARVRLRHGQPGLLEVVINSDPDNTVNNCY